MDGSSVSYRTEFETDGDAKGWQVVKVLENLSSSYATCLPKDRYPLKKDKIRRPIMIYDKKDGPFQLGKSIGSRPTPIKSSCRRNGVLTFFLLLVRPLDFPGVDFFVRSGQLLVDRPMAGIDQHAVEGFPATPGDRRRFRIPCRPTRFPSPRHDRRIPPG